MLSLEHKTTALLIFPHTVEWKVQKPPDAECQGDGVSFSSSIAVMLTVAEVPQLQVAPPEHTVALILVWQSSFGRFGPY